MPKISVIIPVYNTAEYVRECLDSVTNQTLTDIEIVCVDDGSTDGALEILQSYASKDERIKVLKQTNQGAGVARNAGLKVATGEYINFFDSDDYMSPMMLEELYNRAVETNSEITICRSEYLNQVDMSKSPITFSVEKNIIGNTLLIKPLELSRYIFQFCVGWPWDKLYKRDFILNNNLEFQNLRHSNDTYFVLLSLVLADTISITDKILVSHRTHCFSLESTRKQSPECFYYALMQLYKALKEKKLFKIYEQSFMNYCFTFSFWHIDSIGCQNARKKMLKKFKKLYGELNFKKYNDLDFYDVDICNYLKNKVKYMSFPRNIFSVRNSEDKRHKVVTLFGGKLKIARGGSGKRESVPVVFATNKNYVIPCTVAIKSLIKYASKKRQYEIFVINTELDNEDVKGFENLSTKNVTVRCLDSSRLEEACFKYVQGHFSKEVYYRLLIPELFPQFSKVVYLDCDILIKRDIAKLYDCDIENYVLGAVINPLVNSKKYAEETLKVAPETYFNSGVLLINCKEFIKNDIKNQCLDLLNTYKKFRCVDQDLLNMTCYKKVMFLDFKWNYQWLFKILNIEIPDYCNKEFSKAAKAPYIVHFTSDKKPWNYNDKHYRAEWLKFCTKEQRKLIEQ